MVSAPLLRPCVKRLLPILLGLLLPVVPLEAATWIALDSKAVAGAPASIEPLAGTASGLVLRARFPGFRLAGRSHPLAGDYTAPEIPGCGVSETAGEPELPVLRRLLVAPDGADLRLAIRGAPRHFILPGKVQAFHPRQRPRPKAAGSDRLRPFDFSLDAYARNRFAPALPARLREAGTEAGRRLVLLEVFPAAVNPVTQGLRVYPELLLTVSFTGTANGSAPVHDRMPAAGLALNTVTAGEVKASPRLLILARTDWLPALAPLVERRRAQGWSVNAFGAEAAGGTADALRAFIRNRYGNPATRPDALLLAGDVEQIPCFAGTRDDHPDTDLYYGCMDDGDDWRQDFPVGRLSAATPESLAEIVAKILAVEDAGDDPWVTRVAFLAGRDNHAITEGTHDAVIAQLQPRGYACDRLYVTREGAGPEQVRAAFNEGRLIGAYSGHGGAAAWVDGPAFYKGDVRALSNRDRYPLVLSFACLTGKYRLSECFAETWLRQPSKGACGVIASSVTSYWDEDDIFERRLFDAFFPERLRGFGEALLRAKTRLIETYGLSDTVHRYHEQYNLFGDPSARLAEPALSILTTPSLPAGKVGRPYSLTLIGAGGREPYSWTLLSTLPRGLKLDRSAGVLSGTPRETADSLPVLIRLADSAGVTANGRFLLNVEPSLLRIMGGLDAGPFPAGAAFRSPLTAKGGVKPYRWRFKTPGDYERQTGTGRWSPAGRALDRAGDEKSWKLALPFLFPFFGTTRASLWIHSNGCLDFESGDSQRDPSGAELARHARIAPLWADLVTTNLYLYSASNKVVIRWTGRGRETGGPVDFQAVLKQNGSIQFAYRSTEGAPGATVGLASGAGTNSIPGAFDGAGPIPAGSAETFVWRPALGPGVVLSAEGVLSGTAAGPAVRRATVVVSDRSIPAQEAEAEVTLQVE